MANFYLFGVITALLSTFGILVNLFTIILFTVSNRLRTPVNFFLLVLAYSDGFTLLIFFLNSVTESIGLAEGLLSRGTACTVMGILVALQCYTSTCAIAATSAMRYGLVVFPQLSKKYITWKTCALVSLVIGVTGILGVVVVQWTSPIGSYHFYEASRLCALDWGRSRVYSGCVLIFGVFIPNLLISFFYVSILRAFKKSKRRVGIQQVTNSSGTRATRNQDMRLSLQIFVVFVMFTATWGPLYLLLYFVDPDNIENAEIYFTLTGMKAVNSSTNPFVYLVFNRTFRQEGEKLFMRWAIRKNHHCAENYYTTQNVIQTGPCTFAESRLNNRKFK